MSVAKVELDPTRVHVMHLGKELYDNSPSVFLLRDYIKEDVSTSPDKPPKEARPRGSHSSVMLDLGDSVMSVLNMGDEILIRHFTCTPPPSGDLESTVGQNGKFASYELVDNDCKLIARVTHITHRQARNGHIPFLIYPIQEAQQENIISRAREALASIG